MTQVDMMSNSLLTLGKSFVMIFGYSTITQDFLKQSIFKDDKFVLTPDHFQYTNSDRGICVTLNPNLQVTILTLVARRW